MKASTVKLQHPSGSTASIEYASRTARWEAADIWPLYRLFGAHVTSWKTPDAVERLYMSAKTSLIGPAPIRGGVPICFPFFGPPPTAEQASSDPLLAAHTAPELASLTHGFVRTSPWELVSTTPTSATFSFPASEVPSSYGTLDIGYTVTLADKELTTELTATSKERVKVKMAYHTYHAVQDSDECEVAGLVTGVRVRDNLLEGAESVWEGGTVSMRSETATAVLGAFNEFNEPLVLEDGPTKIAISASGLTDAMLWNPKDKAGTSVWSDMEVGDAKRFTCVEPAILGEWKVLEPGETFVASQTLCLL